jgi:DEAD/DEAH box helicase domain-containing protein
MSKVEALCRLLEKKEEFIGQVAHWENVPAKKGEYAPLPEGIDRRILDALKGAGVERVYTHQRTCYDSVRRGNHTVVVTPTASGKTLCYNLPVLQTLLEDENSRALYIFPTKALSQDQQSELNLIIEEGKLPLPVYTYDGDTPNSVRIAARKSGRIVISNPDMLHAGILPNHPRWIKFISALKFVVIDEIHTYRGVFGSHMANLLRRLKRICAFYGTEPVFICCSATIGNPKELTEQLLETGVELIDQNGAPSGEKNIILYNPPLVDRVQGIRRGVVLESQRIGAMVLREKIKTIIFARSRVRTELIASYLRNSLASFYTDNHRVRIESYRGGYLPKERRAIEKGLREGTIHGVVSTNALELGIDIGGLDVSILAGIPGSIASAWQQAGRAGRRNTLSCAILIASASPTDQYIIKHPEYFLSRSPESGWVDPGNIYILIDHLKCAVFELPMKSGETFGGPVEELLEYLEENGTVRFTDGSWYWADRSYPAEHISLRTATSENVIIIDTTEGKNEVIGEMDLPSAKEMLYEGSVYIHRGSQYIVQELDLKENRCYVKTSTVNFYTDAIVKTDIKILEEDETSSFRDITTMLGDILVRRQVAKYKKLKYGTHENIGYGEVYVPEDEMHTRALVLLMEKGSRAAALLDTLTEEMREQLLSRVGTLLLNVAPFFLLCDKHDMGISERVRDPHFELPALYFYDKYPGGIGLAEGFTEKLSEILTAALEVVSGCPCTGGCPSCIGPESSSSEVYAVSEEVNLKELAVKFLRQFGE